MDRKFKNPGFSTVFTESEKPTAKIVSQVSYTLLDNNLGNAIRKLQDIVQ